MKIMKILFFNIQTFIVMSKLDHIVNSQFPKKDKDIYPKVKIS